MEVDLEVIALLLGERADQSWHPRGFVEGAQRLVRSSDGRVSLEDDSGRRIADSDYETAPLIGLSFRSRFLLVFTEFESSPMLVAGIIYQLSKENGTRCCNWSSCPP